VSAEEAAKPFPAADQYDVREVAGWTVRVEKALQKREPELTKRALRLVEHRLGELRALLPQAALEDLASTAVWVSRNTGHSGAVYHPSADWLRRHGHPPEMAGAVEIPNLKHFVEWGREQPMSLLHEMAHALHHKRYNHRIPEVERAYRHARENGLYREVLYFDGNVREAYAVKNVKEYFAELSEAYFGRNDIYPFTRRELRTHDPDGYRAVERAWAETAD
jgi:hypothetical protein